MKANENQIKKQNQKVNIRDESKKKDHELDYGINQKNRAIKRLNDYLEILEELPTGAYEYGWYSLNNALENLGQKIYNLQDKNDDGWGGNKFEDDTITEEWEESDENK